MQAKTDKPAKKEKAKKDPNAPKRGLSAFMYFSNEERPKVILPHQTVIEGPNCSGIPAAALCSDLPMVLKLALLCR